MKVFVDSGVYIDYLQGNNVRLHLLETLEDLIRKDRFKLIFPNITKEEIYRGIPVDRKRFSENEKLKLTLPPVPAGVEEGEKYKEAEKLLDNYNETFEKVRKESLAAVDSILTDHIGKLLQMSEDIREDKTVLEAAQLRKLKANPPGKTTDPIGDEIAWELLLQKCSDDDLAIISHDVDWKSSDGEKTVLHPFLRKEWEEKSEKEITLFPSLTPFIKTIDPKKVTKADNEAEKRGINPPPLSVSVSDSIRVGSNVTISASPGPFAPGTPFYGPISHSVSASPLASSPSEWQPVTVVGTNQTVQCFSCGRWVSPSDYYGLTPTGYKCKFCAY